MNKAVATGRRALDSKAPARRKKPVVAGRTTAPLVLSVPGASQADKLRRLRPRGMAIARPRDRKPFRDVVERDGERVEREAELKVEDLWLGPTGGPPHIPDVLEEFRCNICLQLKSHPVSCAFISSF